MEKLLISIVVPVYSGEMYIQNLISAIKSVKFSWEEGGYPIALAEVIMVDDASIDNSSNVLKTVSQSNDWVRIITLSKNYGQHFATIAGILYTSGDWIITMDEDLQHDPSYIFEILKIAITKSYDIVYASPTQGVHFSRFRDFGSKFYKKVMASLANNNNIRYFNSFRAIRGTVARAAASVCGHEMYIDMVFSWFTNRVGVFSVNLIDERYKKERKSGYNLKKLISHARRLFVSAQTRFLRVGIFIGIASLFCSIFFTILILLLFLFFPHLIRSQGWTSLIVVILFFGGLISLFLSILIEYISIILMQSQGKPTFHVVNRDKDEVLIKWLINNK